MNEVLARLVEAAKVLPTRVADGAREVWAAWVRPLIGPLLLLLVGGIAGWFIRNASSPFVLDDAFWRDFWSGPPAAGIFALAGAVIAYIAALIAARTARRNARRDEWWKRTEWALGLTVTPEHRDAGLAALEVLAKDGTTTEVAMIDAVTSAFLGPELAEDVDTPADPGAK